MHVAGIENRVPDFLSRWHTKGAYEALFWNEMVRMGKIHAIKEVAVSDSMLELTNSW